MKTRDTLYIVGKKNLVHAETNKTQILVLTNAKTLVPPKQTLIVFGQQFQAINYYSVEKMIDELKEVLVIS